MTMSQDLDYFAMRAAEERQRALSAADPKARRVHLVLAAKYAMLAGPEASLSGDDELEMQRRSA
jgi:hypothetical protein